MATINMNTVYDPLQEEFRRAQAKANTVTTAAPWTSPNLTSASIDYGAIASPTLSHARDDSTIPAHRADMIMAFELLFNMSRIPYTPLRPSVMLKGYNASGHVDASRHSAFVVVRCQFQGQNCTFAFETAEMTEAEIKGLAVAAYIGNVEEIANIYAMCRVIRPMAGKGESRDEAVKEQGP